MITQIQLSQYLDLKASSDELVRRLERERKLILALVAKESPVEPGDCSVKVVTRESRSFSYDELVDVIGRKTTDFLKDQMPIRTSEMLIVTGH